MYNRPSLAKTSIVAAIEEDLERNPAVDGFQRHAVERLPGGIVDDRLPAQAEADLLGRARVIAALMWNNSPWISAKGFVPGFKARAV